MPEVRSHITANGTTTLIDKGVFVAQVVCTCSNAGTTWTVSLQSRGSPPMTLVMGDTKAADVGIPQISKFDPPVLMESGVNVVAAGGTAGALDIWLVYQPFPTPS